MATFYDDFEIDTEGSEPRNWTNLGETLAKFEADSTSAIQGDLSLDIQATASSNLAICVVPLPVPYMDRRPFKGTIWMISNSEKHEINLWSGTALPGEQLVRLRFYNDGNFYYRDGAAFINAGPYPNLADITFEITIDTEAGTYSFRVTDGGSFDVRVTGAEISTSQPLEVRYAGFTVWESARLVADNVQIGDLPLDVDLQEGDVRAKVGPWIIGSKMEDAVLDYNVLHEKNEVGEAWIDVSDEIANLVEAGAEFSLSIVPWLGSSPEQFFYGMIFDKNVSGPDTIRILARDAISTLENIEIDSFYFGGLRDNLELDIEEGATSLDPVYVDLPDAYSDVHKPLTRVQFAEDLGFIERPTDDEISGKTPTYTIISLANGLRWVATPFVAEHPRWVALGFEGDEPTPQTWTIKIVGAKIDGSPDLSTEFYSSSGNSSVSGYHLVQFVTDEPFRLNIGRRYYILIGPDNPASPYEYRFYSYDVRLAGTPKVKTNAGVWTYDPSGAGSWTEDVPDETGRILHYYLEWKTAKEVEDWNLVDAGANARIIFNGDNALRPRWILNGTSYQKGARVFYSYDEIDVASILADILNDIATVDYEVTTGDTYIRSADALEVNALDFVQELVSVNNWRLRQRHRSEGGGSLDDPPTVVAEPLPSLGSPVYDFKHGDDSSDIVEEARIVSDNIRKTSTDVFTMVRISGKTNDDRLLLYVQQNVDLQRDLKLLNGRVIPNTIFGFRKQQVLKVQSVNNIEDLQEFAESLLAQSGEITWKGSLTIDGASWLVPGDSITYENSRRDLPETEFRVSSVQYLPHQMKIVLSNVPQRLEYLFRTLQKDLGRFGTLQTLDVSSLSHTFFAWGEEDDSLGSVVSASEHRARLEDLSGAVSTWRLCETVDGPTINGLPSKIISCYFPPEDGTGGQGTAIRVRVKENLDVAPSVLVTLDVAAYHWADNAVTVNILLYQS